MYKDIVSINLLFLKNKENKNLKVTLKQWIQKNILILATCGLDNLKSPISEFGLGVFLKAKLISASM